MDWAAEWRAGIMEGPGRRWAFVRCAHVAMARGPRVYCDWTVSGLWHVSSCTKCQEERGEDWREIILPMSPSFLSSKRRKCFRREIA